MTDLNPAQIKNFPLDNPKARLYLCRRKDRAEVLYVVESNYVYDAKTRKTRTYTRYLGRVVKGTYYTQAQYRAAFTKNGKIRALPDDAQLPKTRLRPTKHRTEKSLIDREKVKGLPQDPFLQFMQRGEHLYVFRRAYYILEGRRKEQRLYVGQIKNFRFYTMEEYRQKFNKNRRAAIKATHQESQP
ncbi:MAG: hypothetical protein K6F05_07110 [Succinivibrio sp.]|nr:hypothetical protein [Succinivibrio sp.]